MGESSRRGVRLTRDNSTHNSTDSSTDTSAQATVDLDALYDRVLDLRGDVAGALELASDVGESAPLPGRGRTIVLWEMLATIAAADVTVARAVEPHLDALAILDQVATLDPAAPSDQAEPRPARPGQSWGVFAAEATGLRLDARSTDEGWMLDGTKPWCSLAGRLSHALVTAHTPGGHRRLFAVDLAHRGVAVAGDRWAARGLAGIPSGPVHFDGVNARPIGADEWYLRRAGFAWGALGVAAVWWGASVGVARALLDGRPDPDLIALMHLGAVDVRLEAGRLALHAASAEVDRPVGAPTHRTLAATTRTIVADSAEEILRRCARSLGPGPLATDERHAGRVADLGMYLRQHHAERDEAAIGRSIVAGAGSW